jgi:hypothetical protein
MEQKQEELRKELYLLFPAARLYLSLSIFLALYLANDYSNLILGGVAGYLIYPLVEYFIRVTSD